MNKRLGLIALVGWMVLWGSAGGWAAEAESQGQGQGQGNSVGLTSTQAAALFQACQATAATTPSPLRKTPGSKMWCAVVNREGKLLLIRATDTNGTPSDPAGSNAWRGSIEIAIAKAYTAVAFSSHDLALDSKTIGLLARPDGPGSTLPADIGTDAGVAPLFGIGNTNPFRPLYGGVGSSHDEGLGLRHHGIVTFAGGQPVYNCQGTLLGAIGVSGDGVDQDDIVAKGAVTGAGFCMAP
jgi:uncharacterized protein GlcG (DUF336 family)